MKVTKVNDVIITTFETVRKGIFFRNPFFKQYYGLDDGWFDDRQPAPDLENLGIVHRLLNSKKTINLLKDFVNQDNAAGYKLWNLRSPLYFEREERSAELISDRVTIKAHGYNFVDERVSGGCESETTKVYIDGKLIAKYESSERNAYKNTYEHVLRDLCDLHK
jgi:hypothetical protein